MSATAEIKALLEAAFSPEKLEIIDDSWRHAGHAGSKEHGGGHFRVIMKAECLQGLSRLESHRRVNRALAPLFPASIHALSLELVHS